ncbi:MAG: DUF5615 family PIN-like protein [Candidatus Hydrogenedentes bacterium]|nr:DUF5615 family PIN-like protein [Candidatus Hydrogenedentota bacterium]
MFQFLADENLNTAIVPGLLMRLPELGIVRARDAGLAGLDDAAILDWAAEHGQIVLTHDRASTNKES